MRTTISIVGLAILLAATAYSQSDEAKKLRYVRVPEEVGRVFIASQTSSALKFEEVQVLISQVDGSPTVRYVLRNTSSKSVKSFTVEFYRSSTVRDWGKYGISTGHSVGAEDGSGNSLIEPRSVFENIRKNEFIEVEPNDKVNAIFNLTNGSTKPFVLFLCVVTKIVFADGTTYRDESDLSSFLK